MFGMVDIFGGQGGFNSISQQKIVRLRQVSHPILRLIYTIRIN